MLKKVTPIVAIIIIGGLEAYAMHLGFNGVALSGSVAIIAGLGGFAARSVVSKPKNKET